MKKGHLGPQLSVWIMQVSLFSSVHINRFHCTSILVCIGHVHWVKIIDPSH